MREWGEDQTQADFHRISMIQKQLGSWAEFERELASPSEAAGRQPALYRGQRCSAWKLQTTLERHGCSNYPVLQYIEDQRKAALAVETVTGKKWEMEPATDGYLVRDDDIHVTPTGYSFMAFLRQNGFPSPLLDWSRSPYVAAFFAFSNAAPMADESVAIFEYVQSRDGNWQGCSDQATILPLGPWIGTDKKHFLQQSEYTICRKDGAAGGLVYTSHEEAFDRGSENQDLLTKWLIPSREKETVMRALRRMNITRYSLFESMEGLMDVIAADILGRSL